MMDQNLIDAVNDLDDARGDDEQEDGIVKLLRPGEIYRIPSGEYRGLELPGIVPVKAHQYDRVMALREAIILDPEFQQRSATIAHTYVELRKLADQKKAELDALNLKMEAVKLLMLDQFMTDDVKNLKFDGGDRVRWEPRPHAVVVDKEAHRRWSLAQGLERDMVLPWGKSNKLVCDMLKVGQELPDGLEAFVRPRVYFTKGGK